MSISPSASKEKSLFVYGLLLSLHCFSILVNHYLQVSFNLKVIFASGWTQNIVSEPSQWPIVVCLMLVMISSTAVQGSQLWRRSFCIGSSSFSIVLMTSIKTPPPQLRLQNVFPVIFIALPLGFCILSPLVWSSVVSSAVWKSSNCHHSTTQNEERQRRTELL